MIPWTAGGDGDGHLSGDDQEPAFACQDGGFEPATKSGGEVQEKEREKPESLLEKEEFDKKNTKEKREATEAREAGSQKPTSRSPTSSKRSVPTASTTTASQT